MIEDFKIVNSYYDNINNISLSPYFGIATTDNSKWNEHEMKRQSLDNNGDIRCEKV